MSLKKDSINTVYLAYQMGNKFPNWYLLDSGTRVTRPNTWNWKLNDEVCSSDNTLRIERFSKITMDCNENC